MGLISLPRWISRLPWIRDQIFQPKVILRSHAKRHVVRYGIMPDGQEWDFGSTLEKNLEQMKKEYSRTLRSLGCRVVGYCEIDGTDFSPLPEKK